MKVIDNFLPSYQFKILERMMRSPEFPWYYNDGILKTHEPHKYQFTHTFYNHNDGTKSYYYSLLDACQNKLGVKKLVRIKANLNTRTLFHRKTGWHYDFEDMTTSILYLNTNNGWTAIKGYGKVENVANRMVIFDSNLQHTGVTCTDQNRRVMINFNYEE